MNAELDFHLPDGRRWQHRFDFPLQVLRADRLDQVLPCLVAAREAAALGRWVVGFVAYEAAPAFDRGLAVAAQCLGPLALFAVYAEAEPVSGGALPGPFEVAGWDSATDREGFDRDIAAIREDIRDGNYYQTNFSRRLHADFAGDGLGLYRALHNAQPGNFSLFLDWGEGQVASVSPELFFHWQPATHTLVSRPMKGTAPRGRHPDEDARQAAELAADPKERAENVMIVDLLRNDLGRLAEPGSVHVSDLFRVEPLPTVWQMTSTVSARVRAGTRLEQVFAALFPCGSVTGAPKGTAMRAIATHEAGPRGVYCGALGVVAPGGEAVFNVPIRTVQIERASQRAWCGIGSGITWSSSAEGEWAEWQAKRRFLWRATAGFSVLETMRLEHGVYALRAAHLARIADAARYFGFPWRAGQVEQLLDQRAVQYPEGCWRVRLLVDRHGSVRAEVHAWSGPRGDDALPSCKPSVAAARPGGAPTTGVTAHGDTAVTVRLAGRAFVEDPDFVRHKTSWRAAYDAFTPDDPAVFDTLLWNRAGQLTEFTRGNLAVCLAGQWYTPPAHCGLLPGVRRQQLLRSGALAERVLTRQDLAAASGLVFLNGLRGCLPARLG